MELEQTRVGKSLELGESRIVRSEHGGVVEVFVDPIGKVVKFAEVHDKAVVVEFVCGEGNGDGPAVPVDA
tara:strand:+ start:438 stop:647 length:210 start_codon:yes stop_codon:yes gene_type:complete